ncbi:hypothetical protein SAMN04487895_101673 [Paenibacillus sophorae]|uniref:Uncharacterized protein n=1 Tax=Paenibacillus sophorae TaxID=1333845 RepID=A0A1H8GZ13_9BACL|nr:hypothetical protein [Paenibacillus sophorae]QWU14367.1 hypothetical protein KP014_20895 [Paenibacillus sophorae]SEN48478.1 hypothetical protein SAMN04487895_101673 [Paenibacillus sophorae]
MKVHLGIENKESDLNVGDVFITKKGNPHMVIYNNFNTKRFQVIKLSGNRQSFVIKCFSTLKDIVENYDIAEVIKSSQVVLNRR